MKIVLTIILLSISLTIFAKDGSSGCGPGWYVLKENSILSSSLRATTNGILVPTVTIGMTFGTSNCAKHKIVKSEKEGLHFATENYFEIAFDSAKGDGDFLMAYGEVLGCGNDSLPVFKQEMKNNVTKIFSPESISPEKVLKETYKVILNNKELTASCFAG